MKALNEREPIDTNRSDKKKRWTNEDRAKLIELRLQGLTFEEAGCRIGRSRHAARSEYGRIRRGETDVLVSLKEMPKLRELLPLRKAPRSNTNNAGRV